jgi:hypothetical protein
MSEAINSAHFISQTMDFIESLGANNVIAGMAMLVALVTGIFTAYQAFLTRKHNRLSVKPHVTTWISEDIVEGYYVLRCEAINNGIGPAIIRDYSVFYEGQKIGSSNDRKSLENAIEQKIDLQPGIIRKSVTVFGKDFPFPIGERQTLLEIQTPLHLQFDKKPYQDFVDKFDADFTYECMYGKKSTHSTKDRHKNEK